MEGALLSTTDTSASASQTIVVLIVKLVTHAIDILVRTEVLALAMEMTLDANVPLATRAALVKIVTTAYLIHV